MHTDWGQYPMFYKWFVKNKHNDKGPCVGFTQPENQTPLNVLQKQNSFSAVLAENAVMIGFDSREQSDIFMKIVQREHVKCLVTDREGGKGLHALFLDSQGLITRGKTSGFLAIGLTADIKHGNRNGTDCLKYAGVERYPVYDEPDYQDVPKWLNPVKGCNIDFLSLNAGDGRNQSLFNYILTLQDNDFTTDEIRETIRLINGYVLKEPLSERELETILRDDAFKKPVFFKGSTFQHDRFAEYMRRESHIVKVNGRLHIYQDGIYRPTQEAIERAMVRQIPQLKDAQRREVLKQLSLICELKQPAPANLIAFKNGLYDLNDDSFRAFTPDVVVTNLIPWPYNPSAYDELLDYTLDRIACGDEMIRALLEEMAGSCLYRSNTLAGGKAFILTGIGANGKSTFLDMVKTMLGEENIASLDLKDLDAKFSNAELFGKLANIGDDIGGEFVSNVTIFRKLVTGERIQVQKKGQDPFEFDNYSKMLFSANDIPRLGRIKEHYAILRRLVIIPFNAKFTEHDPDFRPNIKYDLRSQASMEYLIRLGVEGAKRVLSNKAYTQSEDVEKALNDYKTESNPLLAFLDECKEEDFQIENEPTQMVYRHYKEFCLANNFKELSRIEFSRQIVRQLGLEVGYAKDGNRKTVRVFKSK